MTRMLLDTVPHIVCTIVIAIIVTLVKAPLFVLFYLAAVPLAVGLFMAIRKKIRESNRAFRQSIEDMVRPGHRNDPPDSDHPRAPRRGG